LRFGARENKKVRDNVANQAQIDALRDREVSPQKLFIDGKWQAGTGGELDVISPIDGEVFTTIARGASQDMERAIKSARTAFDDGRWSKMPPAARQKVMHRLADLIAENALEFAVLGVRDNGTEIGMALKAEPGSAAGTFRYYAELINKIQGEIAPTQDGVLGLVHKEPVGVVGAIIPWNFPLMIGAWKIAPALAAGNTIVVKPAETASLTTLRLAELASEAGLPDGVLNVVTGQGSVVGEALARSMDVDVMAFTGSGATGRRLLEYSARSNMKRCYLELGGKSANIVFADTGDLDRAAAVTAQGIFRNAGQVCVAGSRLLVEASIHDEFVSAVVVHAEKMRVGDPLSLATDVGAVNSLPQLQANLKFCDVALSEGAECQLGGKRTLEETGGYFMAPSIFTGVKPQHSLFQDEVFGPVLSVTPFESEAEAVALANNSKFGLAGAVWTQSLSRAHTMVGAVKTGVMHVNCYGGADITVPLAGVKQSGNGADKSMHALDKYLDYKTAWIQL
jgi:gamma-glutamyl-gamma-aminobutyraldehyde dehydrogenase